MPLDSNSRSILGWCVVAVVLLTAWLHGHGSGVDDRALRCEPTVVSTERERNCAVPCRSQEISPSVTPAAGDDASTPVTYIVTTAPRA